MKYQISVVGVTRYAEFVANPDAKKLTRTCLDIEEGGNEENGDVLEVHIREADGPSNIKVAWMILFGKKDDVVKAIEEVFPMAKLESEAIFAALQEDEAEESIVYTYPLAGDVSPIIKKAPIYRLLCASQKSIVASMWSVKPEQVRVLDAINS